MCGHSIVVVVLIALFGLFALIFRRPNENRMGTWYGLFHVLVAAPFLIYVGIQGSKVPSWVYSLLAVVVVGMVAYHGYRAFMKLADGRSAWINWIHLLLVVPALAWIVVQQEKTPRRAFEMVLMLGFAALGYHGYYLVMQKD